GVGTDKARQQVMQSRRLNLQAAFVSARMLGEDLEDDVCSVEHANLERAFKVALLPRAQVFIADEHVERPLEHHLAQSLALSGADEMRRFDLSAPLQVGSNDFGAGGSREL